MIHMNLLGLHEYGRELVVRKLAELKLERQRWLDVTDCLFFNPSSIDDPGSEVGVLAAASPLSQMLRQEMQTQEAAMQVVKQTWRDAWTYMDHRRVQEGVLSIWNMEVCRRALVEAP